MEEIWKDVVGYEGYYQVSNLGRVRSLARTYTTNRCTCHIKGKFLKLSLRKEGYYKVNLNKNNKYETMLVHRMVANAFLPNPRNLPQINHKDEDKKNNHVSNLEWCDAKYNTNYGTCIERMRNSKMKKVAQYDKNGNLIKIWESPTTAYRQANLSYASISSVCLGKRKTYKGYVWKYID